MSRRDLQDRSFENVVFTDSFFGFRGEVLKGSGKVVGGRSLLFIGVFNGFGQLRPVVVRPGFFRRTLGTFGYAGRCCGIQIAGSAVVEQDCGLSAVYLAPECVTDAGLLSGQLA